MKTEVTGQRSKVKGQALLRRETVRRFALEVCAKFGISVSRVNPAFLDSMETICADYIRSQAIASVKDGQKTVGGGDKE